MLELSLNRASRVVSPARILTVIGAGHRPYLAESGMHKIPGRVIEQPVRRGTAVGIFLPLTFVMAADPGGLVILFPSDHFVAPEEQFLTYVVSAGVCAEVLADSIVLLGASAESPDPDLGWIQPGNTVREVPFNQGVKRIRQFHEKPSRELAQNFFARGYLWNTMVVAAKARTLWQMGQDHLPELMSLFDRFRVVLEHTPKGGEILPQIEQTLLELYEEMPCADFCRDLIQRSPEKTMVIPMDKLTWSDWGRPERVIKTLEQLGESAILPRCAAKSLRPDTAPKSIPVPCNCYLSLDPESEAGLVSCCAKGRESGES